MFTWFIAWYDHPLEEPSEAQKEKRLFAELVVAERRRRRARLWASLRKRLRLA
ncbi:MAG: hypothetical protein AAF714_03440 [Pseudomonadota bacterium]